MLGKMIKDFINQNGLKQKKIAEESGMTQQAINDVLNERRKIEATEYFSICKALGVSVDYFAKKIESSREKESA